MDSQRVRANMVDGIATVTLVRPHKRNALDDGMIDQFIQRLGDLSGESLRVVVLTGEGEESFCAGYDINGIDPGQSLDAPLPDTRFEAAIDAVERLRVPVIVAMNGDAYGGGLDLALAGDFRIARQGIKVAMPPCRLGLVYSVSGVNRFVTRLGSQTTRLLFMTAAPMDAIQARDRGIVDDLVPREELLPRCLSLAKQIAACSPEALHGFRRTIQHLEKRDRSKEAREEIERLRRDAFDSDELRRRLAQFRGHRG